MTRRALILAGGGLAGIAWETGILRGIADEVPETARALLDSDVLVGTSAGSTVAAQISSPMPLEELYERQIASTSSELDPGIDIATGELEVFDRSSGVPLVDAVAASCAVPGTWPPVTIGERRYMDGGVSSSVHTAVAADCDSAVVLVPSGQFAPSAFGDGTAAEVAAISARTFAVFADEAALAAFGPNPLDPVCRVPSAKAGREQGRRVAAAVTEFLGPAPGR